ncbi:hypothetical protein MHY85_04355 [Cellulomonas sp. ACRRI]|uniref:hypothetical protein n=1 Tax=Cellulomonas sp. ACRRI TaxID=2918188 RepID=UPI001EF20F6C|nr:hypothetical protein [Cellulomonas sp. ACRRI]MCG7285207.1 hypothetical protein [Cellulomonas sp. ACRRI]
MRRWRIPAGAALVAALLAACGPGATARAAEDVAVAFSAAVADRDGDAACALLAASVAQTVAADAEAPCAQALSEGPVADDLAERAADARPEETRVAGRQAQVRLGSDTVFLARSGAGWVVTAAGCDPRPDRPYDCEVAA